MTEQFRQEIEDLKTRLAEAEETLKALRSGEVDAVVINGPSGPCVYTLKSADHPYQVIVETMTEGAVTTSLDGTVLCANPSLAHIFDRADSSIMGRNLIDFVDPTERPKFEEFLEQARSGPAKGRFLIPVSEGRRTAYFSTSFLQQEGTEPRICMVVTDVTEIEAATGKLQEVEAEKEILQESEKRFRLLAEAIPQFVWTASPDGSLDYVNQSLLEFGGVTLEKALDRGWTSFLHPEDRERTVKVWQEAIDRGTPYEMEHRLRRVHGEYRWLLARALPLRGEDGRISKWFGTSTDITEQKKTAEELRAALEENESQLTKLDAIFKQMTDGLAIFDPQGNLLDMNPVASAIYGFDESSRPRHLHELTEIFEFSDLDGQPLPVEKWPVGRVLKGETFRSYEVRVRRRDTGKTWISSCAGSPVRDQQGRVLMNILTMRDITQIKQAEEELQKAQRLESIGLLAGGIAHDFNNILTAILGNITLARMFLPPGDKAAQRLNVAEQASMRARGLSQQLLTFAKGGAPIKEALEVPPVIKEAVDFALRGSKVRAESSFPPDLRLVEADESQLSQAVNNLAINAVQAMPEGGVLTAAAANVSFSAGNGLGLTAGEYVRIDFKDQGRGIPEKELRRIFDPYYTTKELGSGLGLSISYSIVKRHGGTITVDSKPGKGSIFSIFLPASKKKGATPRKEVHEKIDPGTGRILVMDDEEIVREIAAELLQHLGYQVETVKDGAEAITAYRQALSAGDPFDVVITDLTVPGGMGGKETVQKLLEIDQQAKVIIASGYAHDPVISDYAAYGFKGVIPKPFRLNDLSKTLKEVLGGKE